VTEKTTGQKETSNQVVFMVRRDANKIEIRQAVEKLLNVEVKAVNTDRLPRQVEACRSRALAAPELEEGHRDARGRPRRRVLRERSTISSSLRWRSKLDGHQGLQADLALVAGR
jgi:hypothetical protein